MKNLLFIENNKARAAHIYPTPPMSGIVRQSLMKHLSQEDANTIIEGFKRSNASEDALISDYLLNDIEEFNVTKDKIYHESLDEVNQLFKPANKYKPVSFPDIRYYPWTLSSSAEAPFTTDEGIKQALKEDHEAGIIRDIRPTFHNLYNRMLVHIRQNVHKIKDGEKLDTHGRDLKYWNTAHARSHLVKADEPDKIRMVYGVPKTLLMIECMFLWPLMTNLLLRDGPMLWGYETLKGGWYKLYNWASQNHKAVKTWLAFDWKHFDKRCLFTIIDDLHDIIKTYINFEEGYFPTYDYPNTQTDPKRLNNLWEWMCDAIKHTPDVLPNGDTYIRQHAGIASGYFETQIIGSMYNTLLLIGTLKRMGIQTKKIAIKVQGDDSLIGLLEDIPEQVHESFIQQFAFLADKHYGVILNVKKSRIHKTLDGVKVLGFTNHNGYPLKDQQDLLASLLHPEHQTDLSRLAARTIGIAWANCGNHAIVYRICEEIYNYLTEQKEVTPNMKGLPDLIKSMTINEGYDEDLIPPYFPTWYDTIKNLVNVSVRTSKQNDRIWPSCQFIGLP